MQLYFVKIKGKCMTILIEKLYCKLRHGRLCEFITIFRSEIGKSYELKYLSNSIEHLIICINNKWQPEKLSGCH